MGKLFLLFICVTVFLLKTFSQNTINYNFFIYNHSGYSYPKTKNIWGMMKLGAEKKLSMRYYIGLEVSYNISFIEKRDKNLTDEASLKPHSPNFMSNFGFGISNRILLPLSYEDVEWSISNSIHYNYIPFYSKEIKEVDGQKLVHENYTSCKNFFNVSLGLNFKTKSYGKLLFTTQAGINYYYVKIDTQNIISKLRPFLSFGLSYDLFNQTNKKHNNE